MLQRDLLRVPERQVIGISLMQSSALSHFNSLEEFRRKGALWLYSVRKSASRYQLFWERMSCSLKPCTVTKGGRSSLV